MIWVVWRGNKHTGKSWIIAQPLQFYLWKQIKNNSIRLPLRITPRYYSSWAHLLCPPMCPDYFAIPHALDPPSHIQREIRSLLPLALTDLYASFPRCFSFQFWWGAFHFTCSLALISRKDLEPVCQFCIMQSCPQGCSKSDVEGVGFCS